MNLHEKAAKIIIEKLITKIKNNKNKYILSVVGENGCGKTETSKALVKELKEYNIDALVLGQDNYFFCHHLLLMPKEKLIWNS